MSDPTPLLVSKIRSVSRELVRELGFMNRTVAGTRLSPSAVHTIVEIGANHRLTAKELSEKLLLEKSTISRLVRSLVESGDICEQRSQSDGRSKDLVLTECGRETLTIIDHFAKRQVVDAIAPLNDRSRAHILKGIADYASALRAARSGDIARQSAPDFSLKQGYTPRLLGRMVDMHAACYENLVASGPTFEAKVAAESAAFAQRIANPQNEIWYAMVSDEIVGTIAVDGEALESGQGLLRWFIVEDGFREAGIGSTLIAHALAFCDECQFSEVHLWTFAGLDAARKLYERHGFTLAEERPGERWGAAVLEQRFVRTSQAESLRTGNPLS